MGDWGVRVVGVIELSGKLHFRKSVSYRTVLAGNPMSVAALHCANPYVCEAQKRARSMKLGKWVFELTNNICPSPAHSTTDSVLAPKKYKCNNPVCDVRV